VVFPCANCATEVPVDGVPMPWVCPSCGEAFIGTYNPPCPEFEVLVDLPSDESRAATIATLRSFAVDLRDLPLSHVFDQLRGHHTWSLGAGSSTVAQSICDAATAAGLRARVVGS
jgi:hypothetical protein